MPNMKKDNYNGPIEISQKRSNFEISLVDELSKERKPNIPFQHLCKHCTVGRKC